MKKKGILFVFIILISIVTITARYYSTDHTVSNCYYTQIPRRDVNRESWFIDDFGHKQPIGKEYVLVCFNAMGDSCRVTFINTYDPGTYIKLTTKKNIVTSQRIVSESDVPEYALDKIKHYGTT
ncbi:YxeA family protein [uncultured Catenibacterium sp.]|uniref:YxeA family protein n=1 Tax=uncultured Catenibacterium sp. TaxID=286142 RepID=UPI0025F5C9BA|nr:YxeA family protein [uncultured Catenibacterium sp.]